MVAHEVDGSALVDALRGGDERALADVYALWSPLVYSLALRSLGDVGLAEEVTRRVFTEVWTARATYDPDRSRFSAWLIGLCHAKVGDARTSTLGARGAPAPTSMDRSADGESKPAVLAERLLVAAEMSHLDVVRQRVLRMALDGDLSPAEIASRTGLPVDDVKNHIASSLIELRQRLEVRAHAH